MPALYNLKFYCGNFKTPFINFYFIIYYFYLFIYFFINKLKINFKKYFIIIIIKN